jgi:hypothetical protein
VFGAVCVPFVVLWLCFVLVTGRVGPFFYVPRRLSRYRVHGANLTTEGFASQEDYVFTRLLTEHAGAGPVLDEVRAYWATVRWGRARDAMGPAPDRARSQREFRAAAPDLAGVRKVAAWVLARSRLCWDLVRRVPRPLPGRG